MVEINPSERSKNPTGLNIPLRFPVPPLHGPLVHGVVEVVPGEGAVGVVLSAIMAARDPGHDSVYRAGASSQ
jgi:hypothetical protein